MNRTAKTLITFFILLFIPVIIYSAEADKKEIKLEYKPTSVIKKGLTVYEI